VKTSHVFAEKKMESMTEEELASLSLQQDSDDEDFQNIMDGVSPAPNALNADM